MTMCIPDNTDWSGLRTLDQLKGMNADLKRRAETLGWYMLASLTAYQIGVCPTTIRPCAIGCSPPGSYVAFPVTGAQTSALPLQTIGGVFTPYITGGAWVNSCPCSRKSDCSCSKLSEVLLPGPVGDIVKVMVAGEELPREAYRVDNGDRLVRLDGESWPACQDMNAGPEDDGYFGVTYYRGAAPNEMTNFAAAVLANEFYKACSGESGCRLSKKTTQIARNGQTIQLRAGTFEEDVQNIPEVHAVVRIYNPYALRSRPRAFSPESRRRGRTTTVS